MPDVRVVPPGHRRGDKPITRPMTQAEVDAMAAREQESAARDREQRRRAAIEQALGGADPAAREAALVKAVKKAVDGDGSDLEALERAVKDAERDNPKDGRA